MRTKKKHEGSQDFELNITSIIDCFTVLIVFVLMSASFVSIGILDTEVASAGATSDVEKAPVQISVRLAADRRIDVQVSGKSNHTTHFMPKYTRGSNAPSWDFDALTDHLALLKGEWPKVQAATLVADNSVKYQDVIHSMELTRKAFPGVLLGGY